MNNITVVLIILSGITGLTLLFGLKVISQYERAVRLRFGKYKDTLEPGLKMIIPLVDSIERVDIRQKTIDLKPQSVMTKDQVNLKIDGVVFYTVEDPQKAILNVQDIEKQLEDKATSQLKDIVGDMTMSETLSKREEIAKSLIKVLEESVSDISVKDENKRKPWGVHIKSIQVNNVELPPELVRAMSKQAEAEREKQARKTKAEGEFEASQKFKDASEIYKNNPEALRLRELQTYQEIGTEKNTLMMVIPSSMTHGDNNWIMSMVQPMVKEILAKEKNKPKK